MLAPGWRALIIFGGGVLFYLLTGDFTITLALWAIIYYAEFRRKR